MKNIHRIMKKQNLLLFFLCCLFSAAACGNDNNAAGGTDDTLTVSEKDIHLDASGSSAASITVTAAREWGLYTSDSWIKTSVVSGGKGETSVTVYADMNPTTKEREGSISFMAGAARGTVNVMQEAGEEELYPAPDGYEMVWHDEFDAGTVLNSVDWTHEVQGSGWVNNELQNYVNGYSPEGVPVTELKDGRLRIRCFKENGKIYSGRVYAKVKEGWKYGYIEASIKLPKGRGTWPAFWMMPVHFTSWPADGEIDIMEEVGYRPDYVSSSLHANAHVHSNNTQVTHEMYCKGAEGEFHTYAIEWTADNITTYVDGKVQLSYDNRGLGRDDWPYDDPFYVILNLAWGGSWGGAQGVDESALPAIMEVDYVRVFQKK